MDQSELKQQTTETSAGTGERADRRSFLAGAVTSAGAVGVAALATSAAVGQEPRQRRERVRERTEASSQTHEGVKELVIALRPDTDFSTIVKFLEKVLVVPELPGVRGCSPCLSGLDRLVLRNSVLEAIR
jgi:hypothetical protein